MQLNKIFRVAVVGYGNVGKEVLHALIAADDFEVAGVVRREAQPLDDEFSSIKVVSSIDELGTVDAAILSVPTRKVEETAIPLLKKGIITVDSFDIHTEIVNLRRNLTAAAREGNTVAVISAGWDPGSDSMVRTLMEAIVPQGITYTNFGPGMSMGHSVAVKAIDGVKDALSVTIPVGTGIHRRMVYVETEAGANFEQIAQKVKNDPYFINDETIVSQVDSVAALKDMGHGVDMVRKGVSGVMHNQNLRFFMSINNPALTAQIMVACVRAAARQQPAAYTMPELPVIDLLPGDREEWINKLC